MTRSSTVDRAARMARLTGLAIAALAVLVACAAASSAPAATPEAASPAAVASPPTVASPSAEAASPSASPSVPASATPSAESASPSPSSGPGRYAGGGSTATPTPSPKTTPAPATLTVRTASTGLGKVLIGPNGLTLYTRSSDPANGSGCTASCADNWPPLTVKSGTKLKDGSGVGGAIGTFARADGKRQVTYKGRALYYFAGDSYAGDTNGEGIGGVWHVAKP